MPFWAQTWPSGTFSVGAEGGFTCDLDVCCWSFSMPAATLSVKWIDSDGVYDWRRWWTNSQISSSVNFYVISLCSLRFHGIFARPVNRVRRGDVRSPDCKGPHFVSPADHSRTSISRASASMGEKTFIRGPISPENNYMTSRCLVLRRVSSSK